MLCSGKEIKSYKLLEENFPPSPPIKDAKLYVLNPATDTIKVYITDLNGIPKELQSGGISSDNYVNSLQFNSENGVLTVGRNFLLNLNVSLDGRYIQPGDNVSSLNNDAGYITSQFSPSTLLDDYGFTDNSVNWNTAFDRSVVSASFTGTTTKTLTLTKQDGTTLTADFEDLSSGVGTEVNDLTSSVIWANVPDINITQSSVVQHQAALTIQESQIVGLNYFSGDYNDLTNQPAIPTNTNDYVDSLTYDNVSGLLTLGRTGALSDLTATISPENLTWQHANSTFGSSSDVTENLISGQATSFTSVVVHNAAIMSPEMVTNTIKNKGFAGLDIGGNGDGSSVFAVRIKGSNPNNGNVEIGDSTNDINTWNPISESRKSTVALKRSYKPTAGAVLTSTGDFQFTGVYANNPVNFDVNGEDPNSYYAAFESNPIITGTHLAANPQKIYALRGKGRVLLTDYGSNNVTGTPTYNLAVDASGNVIETALSDTASGETGTEINDLTTAVVWANVPDINITESSITQHQSALSITESQISDLNHFSPSDLATDYSFTDNSSNWNAAYAWGDHSVVGYLSSIPTMEQTAARDGNVSSDVTFNGTTTFTDSMSFSDSGGNYLGYLNDTTFTVLHSTEVVFMTTSADNLLSLRSTDGLELRSLHNIRLKLGDGTNYTIPTVGQVLSAADTDGNLKWTDISSGGSVAGNDTEIQFNNNGAFGSSSNLVWDNTNSRLGINTTPTAALHINSNNFNDHIKVYRGANTGFLFTISGTQAIWGTAAGINEFSIGGNSTFTIKSGNVGINNNSPSEKLDVNGNVKATSFIKTDATSDDILLGDGSTTSLSTLTANNTNIYNSHGSIPANVIRNVTMSTSSILNFQSSTDGGQVVISDSGVKSLFAVTTTDIQLANDSIEILANGTDIASIQGKNGLKLDMTDSGGSETLAVVNNGLLTSYGGTWNPDSNTTTDAVGGGTGSLSDATGVMNVEYVVVVKGATIDLGSGSESYDIGDVVAFDGVKWIKKVDNNQVGGVINASQYRLSTLNTAPTSATDTGTLGEIRVASDYIYVCTATDTWVRTALTTW